MKINRTIIGIFHATSKFAAAGVLALGTATGAYSMDIIACSVKNEALAPFADLEAKLCRRVADALNAHQISPGDFNAAIENQPSSDTASRLHLVEADIVSPSAISYTYAVGTAGDWRTGRQKRFDDLQIDVMDSDLNEAALALLADTISRLND